MKRKIKRDIEKEILKFIYEYHKENGFSPSIRDIQRGVPLKSTSSVLHWVRSLEDSGHIEKKGEIARSITVTKRGRDLLYKMK